MQQIVYNNHVNELDEELTINFKKLLLLFWYRKALIIKVFSAVLIFFIFITFIMPKKYKVEADLYINKANNSNMVEFNPFFIEENGTSGSLIAADTNLIITNELELMKSPLVIDKVIKENNLIIKKKWGIIPNKKEGEYISTKAFLKKNITFVNKKGTNVVTIEYTSKKPEVAYNVVNSIINNYIILHKELNAEKSKSDKKVIEDEYTKAKEALMQKSFMAEGLPEQAAAGSGSLSAMSAFSSSANKALSIIKDQVLEGQRSKMEMTEEAAKVANLSAKLEWAKMVEEMSDTSKVLVLKEPQKFRDFEYASPRLFLNIIIGIIFGILASLFAVIFKEYTDKKLTYTMLGNDILYNLEKDFEDLKLLLLMNRNKNITFIMFDNILSDMYNKLNEFKNINFIKADISNNLIEIVKHSDEIILAVKIGSSNSKLFKQIKEMLIQMNKTIIKEIIV